MRWFASPRAAQIAVAVLIVVVLRSVAEFFRLGGGDGAPITIEQVFYLEGAPAAAAASLVVLLLHMSGRNVAATVTALAAVTGLLLWKVSMTGF